MKGIGYRHLVAVPKRGTPLADATRAIKRDTRRYAKRQWTWFGREEGVQWVPVGPSGPGSALADVKKMIDRTRIFNYSD